MAVDVSDKANKHVILRTAAAMLVAVILMASPTVSAAEQGGAPASGESILLSPTDKRYSLDAGAVTTDSFKVVNDGKVGFNFVTYARPYYVNDDSYAPDFSSKAQNADAYKWIQFDKTSYFVNPGETAEVKYTVRVPANATPGGHYGVLFAETQPTQTNEGTSVLRAKRVGAIMYATVKGDVSLSGKFDSVDVPTFQFRAPLTARQQVSNSGNTDFPVTSTVSVYDLLGGLKYKTQKEAIVLPGTTRSIVNDWQSPAWIGIYKVEQKAKFLDTEKTNTNYVIFVPVWVYMTLVLLIGGRILYAVAHRKRSRKK